MCFYFDSSQVYSGIFRDKYCPIMLATEDKLLGETNFIVSRKFQFDRELSSKSTLLSVSYIGLGC